MRDFLCRHPELRPAAAPGTTCAERWTDGGLDGGHGSFYAQHQLQYWHGVSTGSIWAIHYYGECQSLSELKKIFIAQIM